MSKINFSESVSDYISVQIPLPYIETAVSITNGSADFLGKYMLIAMKDVKNEALMNEFKQSQDHLKNQYRHNYYVTPVENEWLEKQENEFKKYCY